MLKRNHFTFAFILFIMLLFTFCASEREEAEEVSSSAYDDLLSLFEEFREFQKPKVTDGVPDYSPTAMREQRKGLKKFQDRLAAMDISSWPTSHRVDYHIVRAEMNGLEFDHRVLRPWSRDPGFYLKSQSGAGPSYYGRVRLPSLPLSDEGMAEVRMQLKAVPEIYTQAKENLTEASGDLAILALHFMDDEIALYRNIATRLAEHHPELVPDAERAMDAVEDYGHWLEVNKNKMIAPAGLGKENYDWWMKNVQLFPYSWDELMVIAQNEYSRAIALLKLEEHKNRFLPKLKPVATEAEYHRRDKKFKQVMLNFLHKKKIFTVPDYLVVTRDRPWARVPARQGGDKRDFFEQSKDRLPLHMLCHNFIGHNLDALRHRRDNRPIRGMERLYTIDMIRSEGLAYGMEEIMMHLGLFEEYPRGREIYYIGQAFRAVRSIVDLKLHSNEFTLMEGQKYFVENTPYGWTLPDGREVWYETETTLRFPGWHTGMSAGKTQLLTLIADRADQRGDEFNLREFMDEFFASGMIPISLIRWEMTDLEDEIKMLR